MGNQETFNEYCFKLKEEYNPNNKILFIKVPQINLDIFDKTIAHSKGYQVYPPTGLQCLAQAIEGRGLETKILDMNYEFLKRTTSDSHFNPAKWIDILDESLNEYNPSIVGVSNMFRMEKRNFIEILKYLKDSSKKQIVIAGGQNATYEAEKLLKERQVHFVCQREGENKIRAITDAFYAETKDQIPPGILFNYNGNIITTGTERDRVALEGNLINQHRNLPLESYHEVGTLGPFSRMSGDETPFTTISLNRGCRAHCDFCTVRDYIGKGVRGRDVKDVLDEMEYLYAIKGIRHFEFLDDDITNSKKRLSNLLDGISERDMKITWSAQNGIIAYNLDEELLGKMRDSNCIGFKIGVESGNPKMLKKIRKPGTLKSFRAFSQRAQKFPELFMSLNYIIGFPEETFEMMKNTFDFSGEMNSDWSSFSMYIPLGVNKKEGDDEENFIPSKAGKNMEITSSSGELEGYNIFNLSPSHVPSRDQLKNIWSTFNMQRNFIRNKNLQPSGDPKKFIRWMNVLQKTYPLNADMPFFLSLAYKVEGEDTLSQKTLEKTIENFTPYWKKTFDLFNLTEILHNFPKTSAGARNTLEEIAQRHKYY